MDKKENRVSRILRMTFLFFISCAMCVQAETVSSQSIRVTLNKDNVRLENILNGEKYKVRISPTQKTTRLLMYPYATVWLKII